MSTAQPVVADAQPGQLADAATGIGQDGQQRPVADAGRCFGIWSIQQTATFFWAETGRLAILADARRLHELAVRWIGSCVAIEIQIGKERADGRELAPYRRVRLAGCL